MRVRSAALLALLTMLSGTAFAAELPPELRTLIEDIQTHRLVAIGYLRTQNRDLGAVEIERLRDGLIADRAKASPSGQLDRALATAIARTESLVANALAAIDGGDIERARALLEEAGKPLDVWRKDNGIRLFSDCIAEITAAYGALDAHRLNVPDLTNAMAGARVIASTDGVIAALDRCEREAPEATREGPEFRRLLDGMRASLRQLPEAVAAHNGALLYRLLIEQRSFEQLLSFRFG